MPPLQDIFVSISMDLLSLSKIICQKNHFDGDTFATKWEKTIPKISTTKQGPVHNR